MKYLGRLVRLLCVCLLMAVPAYSQDREVAWTSRAENGAQAQLAQEEFFLTLFNTGRLPFRIVPMAGRANLEEVMRQEGAWVGPMTDNIATLLCQMNIDACNQISQAAAGDVLKDHGKHVAGVTAFDRKWTVQATEMVTIPDIRIVQVSTPEPALPDEKPQYMGIQIKKTCVSGNICRDDYRPLSTEEDVIGRLREVEIVTSDTEGKSYPLRLVPQLNAVIALTEKPLESYRLNPATTQRGFSFEDDGFQALEQSIKGNIVGKISINVEASHGSGGGTIFGRNAREPLAVQQGKLLDNFCNVAQHGKCPDFDTSGMGGITVGIIDQIPDITHCDLGDNIVLFKYIDGSWNEVERDEPASSAPNSTCNTILERHQVQRERHHGTHVLGILSAPLNDKGVAGLLAGVPGTRFVVFPFDQIAAEQSATSLSIQISEAITRAATFNNVAIFNFSFSYRPPQDGQKDLIFEAINKWKTRVLFVVAAGGGGEDANKGPCNPRPACYSKSQSNILSVVGLENDADAVILLQHEDEPEKYRTNYGSSVFSIGAPARDIISTVGNNSFGPLTGTSQAAPQVTAAAAILMGRMGYSVQETRDRLIYTSRLSIAAVEQVRGGALDITAALGTEYDWIRLRDGCVLSGIAREYQRNDNGNWIGTSLDMILLPSGAVLSKPLSDMRRIYRQDNAKGIYFYQDGSQITREIADLRGTLELHSFWFEIEAASDNCSDPFAAGNVEHVILADVADFIARDR